MVEAKPESKRGFVAAMKELYNEFSDDDVMTQAAAIAFYTGLSLAPMLTVAVWITRTVFPGDAKERIVKSFEQVLGAQAAYPIRELLDPAEKAASAGMTVAGLLSLALVVFSATGVFAQLQSALNLIWDVQAKTTEGIWSYVRKRFLSFGMLLTILFLLLTSLVVSTIIQSALGVDKKEKAALVETKDSVAAGDVKAADPATQASASTTSPAATPATAPAAEIKKDEEIKKSLLSEAINLIVSFGVFILLFAAMFRYLPDVKIAWSDVWVGAVLTSILFVIGKWGLGIYLGRSASDTDNAYATAVASFVAFLLWVYYSGIIVLIGAEATQVYARHKGHGLEPDEHAVLVEKRNVTLESGNANG